MMRYTGLVLVLLVGACTPADEEVSEGFHISVSAEVESAEALSVSVTQPESVPAGVTATHEITIAASEATELGDPRFTDEVHASNSDGVLFTAAYSATWRQGPDGDPEVEETADERRIVVSPEEPYADTIRLYTEVAGVTLAPGRYVVEQVVPDGVIRPPEGLIRLTYEVQAEAVNSDEGEVEQASNLHWDLPTDGCWITVEGPLDHSAETEVGGEDHGPSDVAAVQAVREYSTRMRNHPPSRELTPTQRRVEVFKRQQFAKALAELERVELEGGSPSEWVWEEDGVLLARAEVERVTSDRWQLAHTDLWLPEDICEMSRSEESRPFPDP
jgi:hypothetical protein